MLVILLLITVGLGIYLLNLLFFSSGETLLMRAVQLNFNPDVIRILLERGADVNARTESGEVALMKAVQSDTNLKTVQILLEYGGEVNTRNIQGVTSLMYAARYNQNPDVTRALLSHGADVNADTYTSEFGFHWNAHVRSDRHVSPLVDAARYNCNPEVVIALLEHGVDVGLDNQGSCVALDEAARWNKNPEVTTALLKHLGKTPENEKIKIDPLIIDSALLAAVENPNPEVVEALLLYGANAQIALMKAARSSSNEKALSILLKYGAISDETDSSGRTALMEAAQWNDNPAVVDVLLSHGADASLRDSSRKTAFDYAKENNALKGTEVYWKLNDARFEVDRISPNDIRPRIRLHLDE